MKVIQGTLGLVGALFVGKACFADTESSSGPSKSAGDETTLEEVVITGSLIRGPQYSASPLRTFSAKDIEQSGRPTVHEFLSVQPAFFRGGIQEGAGGPAAGLMQTGLGTGNNARFTNLGFASSADLHGAGNGATLVLLDGVRLAPIGGGYATDISNLSTSAIEGIAVMSDGASALYGSDAVGGVLNFHLRRDYSGQETRLRYGVATDGGGTERLASQTVGRSWGSGSFLLNGEYYARGAVDALDRSSTNTLPSPTYLLPETERYSLLATVRGEVTPGVELFGTWLGSKRLAHSLTSNEVMVGPSQSLLWRNDHHANVEQFNVISGGSLRFLDTWLSTLTLNYSENDTRRVQAQLRGLVPADPFENEEKAEVASANLKFDGTLIRLFGQDIRAAVGGDYREESFNGGGPRDYTRNIKAGFGQILVPYVFDPQNAESARLELTAAARYEDYSDFGRSRDPKIGLVFALPSVGVNLRGSWGTSFQAPRFPDLYSGEQDLLLPIPNASGGATLTAFRIGSNPLLRPEESENYTFGIDVRSSKVLPLDLSVTYFNILSHGQHAQGRVLFDAFSPQNAGRLNCDPDAATLEYMGQQPESFNPVGAPWTAAQCLVDNRVLNIAKMKLNGIDAMVSYELPLSGSELRFLFDGTYLLEKSLQQSESAPIIDVLNSVDNPVDLRMRGGVAWHSGPWSVAGFVNYVDRYKDSRVPPTVGVDSWTTVDLSLRYELPLSIGIMRGMEVSLNAQNVFGEEPPYLRDFDTSRKGGVHLDAANASPLGPVVAAEFRLNW